MFANRATLASIVACMVAVLACTLILSAGTVAGSSIDQVSKSQTTVRLTKLLDEVRRLSELNRIVEMKVQQALLGADAGSLAAEQQKRETSWDMDYGWGGGRFGKRMDSLGIAGRFGRSVGDESSNH